MDVNKYSKNPIYEQIIAQVQKEIITGVLKAGDKLPSVRELSVQLAVNPNTVQKAYTELEHLGITSSSPGQGRFVTEGAWEIIRNRRMMTIGEIQSLIEYLQEAGMSLEEIFDKIRGERTE